MKVPATPPGSFTVEAADRRVHSGLLWRVYRTEGAHALDWDRLRHHGPVPGQRWDPHPLPRGDHADVGVMYTAVGALTALGEVYQDRRAITRDQGGATLVAWVPSRPLTLLDLTTTWPVRNGASASIMMGPKRHTQAWARAVDQRLGDDVDGLYTLSSITGEPVITLFSRTERFPAFPPRPRFHALLSDAIADPIVQLAVEELGYTSL